MIWYFVLGLLFAGATLGLMAKRMEKHPEPKPMWALIGAGVALFWPLILISVIRSIMKKGKK